MRNGFMSCRNAFRFAVVLVLFATSAGLIPARAAAADDAISIGVVLPVTGKEGKPGQYQKEGIETAVKRINDAGGIFVKDKGKKLPVKIVFYDDESDAAKSASLAERCMTSDNVTAVLGGYSTTLGEAESVMADRHQTPWITTGAGATSTFSRGYQFAFGGLSPITVLGSDTAAFLGSLVDQGKLKKGLTIAMVLENTDHGIDYGSGINQWIEKHPGYFKVVFTEKFEYPGSTDFSGLLQKVKAARADIFLADAHLNDYITMHRQYLQAGLYHQMVSYGARGPDDAARKALGAGTDYIFAGLWWAKNLKYPQVAEFVKEYKAQTGHEPDSWYAAPAYDSMRILAQAIEKAGTLNHVKVRDALRKAELKDSILPSGILKFGPNGQSFYPFLIVQNKPDNKADIILPKDLSTGDPVAPMPKR